MNPRAQFAITDAAGRTELDDRAWLEGLCGALRQCRPRSLGVVGCEVSTGDGIVDLIEAHGDDPAHIPLARQWLSAVGADAVADVFALGARAMCARATFHEGLPTELVEAWRAAGIVDILCLVAVLPDGTGVALWTFESAKIDARASRQAGALAESIRVGLELRTVLGSRRLSDTIGRAIDPRTDSHRPGAVWRAARLSRPDPTGGCEPVPASTPQSVSPWAMLCRGYYRVIDEFDREGRRYMVLVALEKPDPLRALSDLEQRIADLCGQAWGNKQIAYDIGTTESAVENHIGRILCKLRLDSRLALVRLYTQIEGSARAS